jgi:uncharacterized caspase-like protein
MNNRMKSTTNDKEKEGLIAVIVGIDGYEKRPLRCAVNDAVYLTETLQKVWKGRKLIIKTLIWPSLNQEQTKSQRETWGIELPEDAGHITGEAILSTVRQCAGLTSETDTFLFYFAGHGVFTQLEPALITVANDKRVEKINYIKVKEIQQAAAGCASLKKVMILDCCQSTKSKHQPKEGYKNLEELTREWSILLSSSPGEVSLEDQFFGDSRDDYLQQGVFTASLVEGLRGEAVGSSGMVSLADLAYFVGKRVPIEYQQRIFAMPAAKAVKRNQKQTDTRGRGLESQNPVLLSKAVAMDGPYQVVLAPENIHTGHKARRKKPGGQFFTNWLKFLTGPWPINFPFKFLFWLAGLLYAGMMMFTVMWYYPDAINSISMQFFFGAVGLGSFFIWWVTLPFAAAVNEDRWHMGGYFTVLFYLVWHCMVIICLVWICGFESRVPGVNNPFLYFLIDLFFIFIGVVVFGCNASQTIIAMAETIRTDERREIRQAIRIFQEFKYTLVGVDLYNYIAQVSARPVMYLYGWIVVIAVTGSNLYKNGITMELLGAHHFWMVLLRDIFAMIFVTWLVFWYYSAYKYIQHEVYKR